MDLRSRLRSLYLFRVSFLSVMGVSAGMLRYFYREPVAIELIHLMVWGIGFTLISGVLLALARSERMIKILGGAQLFWEVGFVTYLVLQTGGIYSAFVLLYALYTVIFSMVFGYTGALSCCILSCLAFGMVGWRELHLSVGFPFNVFSRFLISLSSLVLCGAFLAWISKNRDSIAKKLNQLNRNYEELSHLHSAIFDHVSSGILYVDAKGKVGLMNRVAFKILEKSWIGESLDGTTLSCLLKPRGRFESKISVASGEKSIGHSVSVLPDGNGCVVVFQDVTEIRSMETKMRTQEKLAAVGQLGAGIAHEIRNPLASLSGSIQLLKSELTLSSESERLMSIVLRETDRLDGLAKSFLEYARLTQLELEDSLVKEMVSEVIDIFKNAPEVCKQNIQLVLEIEEGLHCKCDPRQIKQILWNLIRNGVQSINKEGTVRVMAKSSKFNGIESVQIMVRDSGMGISEDIKPKVFEPFFSTKTGGTGLGLSLVYQMVKAHEGTLGIESKMGEGTLIWFELLKEGPTEASKFSEASVA